MADFFLSVANARHFAAIWTLNEPFASGPAPNQAKENTVPRQFLTLSALLIACLGPGLACAALGEPESSIQGDVAKFQGAVNTTEHLTYRVHEIDLPSGTVLREFVTQGGAVFAVAWRGPVIPNLRQALGKYFDNYVAAAKVSPVNHRRLDISQPDLEVHASGHMRSFSGIAYLPQTVPAGVSVGELR
jgi:Protein of unknown function (DUF2844)